MRNQRCLDQCDLCGKSIDVGLWTRDDGRNLCTLCQIEWDDLRIESIADKLPKAEDWPEVMWPIREEAEDEGQFRWTEEDRRWAMDDDVMDDYYGGLNPVDREP